eukprot:1770024-Pyramimonas_sp.AAC.2
MHSNGILGGRYPRDLCISCILRYERGATQVELASCAAAVSSVMEYSVLDTCGAYTPGRESEAGRIASAPACRMGRLAPESDPV